MSDKKIENPNEEDYKAYAIIFSELLKFTRFEEFITSNYDIKNVIDEKEKTVNTVIIEKPVAVGPKLSTQQLIALKTTINFSGAKDPNSLLTKIFKILGEETDGSKIVT